MKINTFEVKYEEHLPSRIFLSTGEIFDDIHTLYEWCVSQDEPITYYGDLLDAIQTAIVGCETVPIDKIVNEYKLLLGAVMFINILKWDLQIGTDMESRTKIANFIKSFECKKGGLPVSPSLAALRLYSNNTQNTISDPATLETALICSNNHPEMLGIPHIPAYRGGLLNNPAEPNRIYQNILSFDISSAYPAMLVTQTLPCGPDTVTRDVKDVKIVNGVLEDDPNKGFVGLFAIRGVVRKPDVKAPCVSTSNIKDYNPGVNIVCDRLGLLTADIIVIGMCAPEMALFQLQYDYESMNAPYLSTHDLALMPRDGRRLILSYYKKKLEATGHKRQAAKLFINSLIGCFSYDPIKKANIKTVAGLNRALQVYNGVLNEERDPKNGDDKIWVKKPTCLGSHRTWNYLWGVYVNAYTRLYLGMMIHKLTKIGANVLYCDTDSIKVEVDDLNVNPTVEAFSNYNRMFEDAGKLSTPSQYYIDMFETLGHFKAEEGYENGAIFYEKRQYVKCDADYNIKPVMSGVKTSSVENLLKGKTLKQIQKKGSYKVVTQYLKVLDMESLGSKKSLAMTIGTFTVGSKLI